MSNVFWVKGGRLFTPGLNTGCLPGTTRDFILESLDCEEAEAGPDVLLEAEAVYLTSAGLGIVAAARLDERGLDTSDSLRLGRLLPAG
jgi:branched-subunit amino acid aminotransferase/4-amino-4-deoxychorismate lyase